MTDEMKIKVEKFRSQCKKMERQFCDVEAKLTLSASVKDLDVTAAVKDLEAELNSLVNEAKQIKNEISSFLETDMEALTLKEIEEKVTDFKKKLKTLKQKQLRMYQDRAKATNERITSLKAMDVKDEELRKQIDAVQGLDALDSVCVSDWRHNSYLQKIDYNKLVEVNKTVDELSKKANLDTKRSDEIEKDLAALEKNAEVLKGKIKDGMSLQEINALVDEFLISFDMLVDFDIKIAKGLNGIDEEILKEYSEREKKVSTELGEMLDKLLEMKFKSDDKSNDYTKIKDELVVTYSMISNLYNKIKALRGKCNENVMKLFKGYLDEFEKAMLEAEKEIGEKTEESKLDENQQKELNGRVVEIRSVIQESRTKMKDPFMMEDVDIFAFLNSEIDVFDEDIEQLLSEVDKLGKPIKNKEDRKRIDLYVKRLENDIKNLETQLEMYKDRDPEKYKSTKERLEKSKEKLEKVGKKYRSKCPLRVKSVKSAKNFFKKHKKAALIIAGLAAMALLYGQVIIPAIMYGNILMGSAVPALSSFTGFTNNILGGIIGAREVAHNMWMLSVGKMVNSTVATTSFLKGLALSGAGSAALVAPIIIAIKKLNLKMNLPENVKKISNFFGEIPTRIKESSNKRKEKRAQNGKKMPTISDRKQQFADMRRILRLEQLLNKYQKSTLRFDLFCMDVNLSAEMKKQLEEYATMKGIDVYERGRSK